MLLNSKIVYTRQPQTHVQIDQSHSLAKKLSFDLMGSSEYVETLSNVRATSTTGASLLPTNNAIGYKVTQSAGNCIYYSTLQSINRFPFSILIVADTIAEANRKFVFQNGQNNTFPTARIWVLINGTATAQSSSDASGKLYLYTIDTSLNQNSPAAGGINNAIVSGVNHYGITCDGTTTTYYRNGILLGTESPTNTNNVWDSSGIVSIGGASPALSNTRPYDRSLLHVRVWNGRLLTASDFIEQYKNLYGLYKKKNLFLFNSTSNANIYTLSPGGTLTFSGSSIELKTKVLQPGGTITFSNTSPLLKIKTLGLSGLISFSGSSSLTLSNGSTTYTMSPGGTITFSGTNIQAHEKVLQPSGNITFNGTSLELKTHAIIPFGSINFSGTSIEIKNKIIQPTGLITLTGNAVIQGPGSLLGSTKLPLTGVGL